MKLLIIGGSRFVGRHLEALSELVIFEGCSHEPIYESVDEFNQKTLDFLQRH